MTTTVAPAYTHTDMCELTAIGQAVVFLREGREGDRTPDSRPLVDVLDQVIDMAPEYRPRCDCKALALSRVETRLRLVRKAARAATEAGDLVGLRRATVQAVALVTERDRIRDTP